MQKQRDMLNAHGCARIFEDIIPGTQTEAPALRDAFLLMDSGDILVMANVGRLYKGYVALDVAQFLGIGLKFLEGLESAMDPFQPGERWMTHVSMAFADYAAEVAAEG